MGWTRRVTKPHMASAAGTAPPVSNRRWFRLSALKNWLRRWKTSSTGLGLSAAMSLVFGLVLSSSQVVFSIRESGTGHGVSELHARDLLVSGHNLVAHLHHELEAEVSFLDRNHGTVNIGAIASEDAGNFGFGLSLQLLYVVHRRMQNIGKTCLGCGRRPKRPGIRLGRKNSQRRDGAHSIFSLALPHQLKISSTQKSVSAQNLQGLLQHALGRLHGRCIQLVGPHRA